MRTVSLAFSQNDLHTLAEKTSTEEVIRAIGYLTQWNIGRFDVCELFMDTREYGITALYRKEPGGAIGYEIGAVWHGKMFGFHS